MQASLWQTRLKLKNSRTHRAWRRKIKRPPRFSFPLVGLIITLVSTVVQKYFPLTFLKISAVAVCTYIVFLFVYQEAILNSYEKKHADFHTVALYDTNGRFHGGTPAIKGHQTATEHKSFFIADVPETWWQVLVALEDEHLGTWLSWYGIDISAFPRIIYTWLKTREVVGGSSLMMQLIRNINHTAPNGNRWDNLQRKTTELLHTPILMSKLSQNNYRGLKQWLAMHVALVQGVSGTRLGGNTYGLGLTARIIFAKKPEDLNLAEQAILAAAFKWPILIAPQPTESIFARWEKLCDRAQQGINKAYRYAETLHTRATEELKQLRNRIVEQKILPPYGPAAFEAIYPHNEMERFRLLGHPTLRRNKMVSSEMQVANHELESVYGENWPQQLQAVHLLTDTVKQYQFKKAFEKKLQQINQDWRERLQIPLAQQLEQKTMLDQVGFALADAQGRLIHLYQNYQNLYTDHEHSIASLGKLPLAVLAGYLGDQVDRKTYCNHAFEHIHNANGDKGVTTCTPESLYTPRDVFSRSMNLPLIQRFNSVSEHDLTILRDQFGLTAPDKQIASRVALSLGMVTATLRELHSIIHLIATAIYQEKAHRLQPTIVKQVVEINSNTATQLPHPAQHLAPEVEQYFTAQNRAFLKEVLGHVVEAGTLKSLSNWTLPKSHKAVAWHIGKTGTATNSTGEILSKFIVGGLVLNGKLYTYVLFVGTPNPKIPLGVNIPTSALTPLIDMALRKL